MFSGHREALANQNADDPGRPDEFVRRGAPFYLGVAGLRPAGNTIGVDA